MLGEQHTALAYMDSGKKELELWLKETLNNIRQTPQCN